MNPGEYYFNLSMDFVSRWLAKEKIAWIQKNHAWYLEKDSLYSYFLFFFPETKGLDCVIVFVFDHHNQMIADLSAYLSDGASFLMSREIYDFLSDDSDWMYLEHWIAGSCFYPDFPYASFDEVLNDKEERQLFSSDRIVFFANAYVTKAYRNQGIFHNMVSILNEYVLDQCDEGSFQLFHVISLDPDIACYGPDADPVEYHYSYAEDEPERAVNRRILQEMGYTILYLEEETPAAQSDGCKIQFAIKKEEIRVLDGVNPA